jgi:D-3-phosphoglycerate dehydrogenase / 2-oxoglutarate reductase
MDLKNCRILVTPTSYGKNDPRLKSELEALVGEVIYNTSGKPLNSGDVARLLPGVDGYIAGLDQIDRAAISAASGLKVIARYGVGYDNVDLQAASEHGILVCNTPGANSVSVAELALGLMLALARQLTQADAAVRRGQFPRMSGVSLEGKTIGILGLGAIGKQLARRLAGFDCRLLAYDPYPDLAFAAAHQVELTGMDAVLSSADFLSLHLPLTAETRRMVNGDFLAKMKKGSYLINAARGELVDEDALAEALCSGRLAGAGLDAFVEEPPSVEHPLLKMPNLIATPHLGAQTDGATNNMGWVAFNECLSVLRGESPRYRVA